MMALVTAVFVASLMGSLHCAGMCGAFVAFAVGLDGKSSVRERARLQSAYHAGRLITYMTLGLIAGALGHAFDLAGEMVGVSRVAVMIAGATMVLFGGMIILRLNGVKLAPMPVPGFMRRGTERAMRFAVARPPFLRALVTGLATTLLPCGWLYAFVVTSAGTGSPVLGATTMAVFWLGTLPVMVAVGAGAQALASRAGWLGRRAPALVAVAVIAIGLFNVFHRGMMTPELTGMLHRPDAQPVSLVDEVRMISESGAGHCHVGP